MATNRKEHKYSREKAERLATHAHLKAWLNAAGLIARTAAEGTGIDHTLVARWVRGAVGAEAERLAPIRQNIANALGVPVESVDLSRPPPSELSAQPLESENAALPPEGVEQAMYIEGTPHLLRRIDQLLQSNEALSNSNLALSDAVRDLVQVLGRTPPAPAPSATAEDPLITELRRRLG